MSSYEDLQEAVSKLEGLSEEQKKSILDPAGVLNTDNGIKGSDLIKTKQSLEKMTKNNINYMDFVKKLNISYSIGFSWIDSS